MNSKNQQKGIALIVILGIVAVVLLIGAFLFTTTKNPLVSSPTPTQVENVSPTPQASPSVAPSTGANIKSFEINGSNFKFTPSALSVNEGDTVKITLKNTGGMHNFVIDEFNVETKTIQAGQEDVVEFIANKKGSFEFYCSIGQHRAMGMVGTLTVK